MRKNEILSSPTRPLAVDRRKNVGALLEKMQGISFQGRNLARAYHVWQRMLEDRVMIMMGMSGAMVPAGMRRLVVYLIKNRLIDCLVSTGANFFHDIHETLGRLHFQCSPDVDDVALQEHLIDRMYDTLADEEEFREEDAFVGRFAAGLDQSRPYTTREFLNLLGKEISKRAKEDGIVTAAYKASIPLYCPAIGDSSIGIGIAENRHLGKNRFTFDVIGDVVETARLAGESPGSGVIYFGGGTPKNFVQQSEVTATFMRQAHSGHKYALQVVTDAPHWGGLSGCSFEEAQSWGKIAHDAHMVTVHCDSTIAMPILVTALSENTALIRRRKKPVFRMGRTLSFSFPK
ncbi:MAG: deoxyhypusine synthase family protein [Acidobacteria bacterium]|nr:deoxyhypusine synthase family protein [Acidobacteriota bacterium]